jgi:hypothetical protein
LLLRSAATSVYAEIGDKFQHKARIFTGFRRSSFLPVIMKQCTRDSRMANTDLKC